MTRLGRAFAFVCVILGLLLTAAPLARADHCDPIDVGPVEDERTWCHTPKPTPKPATPKPTEAPDPTTAPTAAPTRAPAPAPATRTQAPASRTAEPTPFDVEVPEDEDPLATPEIIVDGPIDPSDENFNVDATPAASGASFLWGLIIGFIVGGLIGRASWGLRRRRRQQIFG